MPLDEATRRFGFLLQRDLRRLLDRHAQREARGEALRFDSVSRLATFESRHGDVSARLYGEVLAVYSPYDRILRWAWAGRAPSTGITYADVVVREGQARGVAQLTMSVVGDLDRDDARTLVMLGALVARAEGFHERVVGGDVHYVGLFERPRPLEAEPTPPAPSADARFSVPPPPAPDRAREVPSAPPPPAYRSLPPIREIFEPRTGGSRPPPPTEETSAAAAPKVGSRKLREPARAIFLPVANAALAALARASHGYVQGLFVVTSEIDGAAAQAPAARARRIHVQLVAIDAAGILRSLDPPSALVEAAVAMVEADRRDGNGAWRKLSARILPKADGGATLHVDVT